MEYDENSIITWGKYKFTAIKRIPASWLLSYHKNNSLKDKKFLEYLATNLDELKRRQKEEEINKPVEQIFDKCNKYQYSSKEQAEKHLKEIRKSGKKTPSHVLPVRAYMCDKCPFWHLTSKKFVEFEKQFVISQNKALLYCFCGMRTIQQ